MKAALWLAGCAVAGGVLGWHIGWGEVAGIVAEARARSEFVDGTGFPIIGYGTTLAGAGLGTTLGLVVLKAIHWARSRPAA